MEKQEGSWGRGGPFYDCYRYFYLATLGAHYGTVEIS